MPAAEMQPRPAHRAAGFPHPAASKQTGNFNPKPSDVANPAE